MANENNKILTAEQELELRRPIEDHIGKIQAKIDGLRADGTDKVVAMQNAIDTMKRDKSLTKEEREHRIAAAHKELEQAKEIIKMYLDGYKRTAAEDGNSSVEILR